MPLTPPVKLPVEEMLPEAQRLINRRRSSWAYTSIEEWEDISQKLLIRVWTKYPLFDPSIRPFEHWVNILITNTLKNLRRDLAGKWLRPCIGGDKAAGKHCAYNRGGNLCSFTKSGTQCSECTLYADWLKRKGTQFNIHSTVALENHSQEVNNKQCDFMDIEAATKVIHTKMLAELTPFERRVYRLLFVKHMKAQEVSDHLKKRYPTKGGEIGAEGVGYQSILTMQRQFKSMIQLIVKREEL